MPCPCGATGTTPPPPAAATAAARTAATAAATGGRDYVECSRIRVIDGDTLKVRLTTGTIRNVRLIGIDTPETRKPGTAVECGGRQATARMKQLAFINGRGRLVRLTSDPTQDRFDRFRRMLAYVSSAGVDFGRAMISSGWAKSYVFEREFERLPAYRRAEATARAARRGAWRRCGGNFHRPA